MRGYIKWYNIMEGFGIIAAENGVDVPVYFSEILEPGFKFLIGGEEVSFDTEMGRTGVIAKKVKRIGEEVKLGSFDFKVEELYEVKGRGIVVEGRCESGTISVGDEVVSSKLGDVFRVLGIVKNKNLINQIDNPGEYGILLNTENMYLFEKEASLFSFYKVPKKTEISGDDYLNMGDDYYYGRNGKEKDIEKSIECYELAISKGASEAYYQLGNLYWWNDDVDYEENEKKAFKILHEGVLNGIDDCYGRLGYMYDYIGEGKNAYVAYEKYFNGDDYYYDNLSCFIYRDYILFCKKYSLNIDPSKITTMSLEKNNIFEYEFPDVAENRNEHMKIVDNLSFFTKILGFPDDVDVKEKIRKLINQKF